MQENPSVVRFGAYEVDLRTGELRKHGHRVPIEEKPFQALALLLERPAELISRHEFRERLWSGIAFMEFDDCLNHAIKKLRAALGDAVRNPRYVETLPKRGYRFIAPLSFHAPPPQGSTVLELGAARRRATQNLGLGVSTVHAVGRKQELAELAARYRGATAGRGGCVCVTGDAGLGKSTLVEQFFASLALEGAPLLLARGRCSERLAGAEAYLPVIEALDDLLYAGGPDIAEAMRRAAPGWYMQVIPRDGHSAEAYNPPLVPALSQERLKREFLAFLREASRQAAVTVFLDDLHWADASTCDLLLYSASRLEFERVLFIGAYRPTEMLLAENPVFRLLQGLQTHGRYYQIELAVLAEEDVAEFLDLEFPGHQFPDDFSATLARRTEGIPLFMADLVRDLVTSCAIAMQDRAWRLVQPPDQLGTRIPASVRGMIQRKFARLCAGDRALLDAASVRGAVFDTALLAEVAESPAAAVEERLEGLDHVHGIVRFVGAREFPDGTLTLGYSFAHALYQEALHDSLKPTKQALLSARFAEALLNHYPDGTEEIILDLALLFETSRDFARASEAFLAASRKAARNCANHEAVELSKRSIACARELPEPARSASIASAALHLGYLRQTLSQIEPSLADFELSEQAARAACDAEIQVLALCGAGMSMFLGRRPLEQKQLALRALGIASAANLKVAEAMARTILAISCVAPGDLATARQNLDQSSAVLKVSGRISAAQLSVAYRGLVHSFQSEYRQAADALEWAVEKSLDCGNPLDAVRNLWFKGMALANNGNGGRALHSLNECARLAELNGEKYWSLRVPNTLGWLHYEFGDFRSAMNLNSAGIDAAVAAGAPEVEANSRINLARVLVDLGDFEQASVQLRHGERLLREHLEVTWMRWRFDIRLRAEFAYYHLRTGDLDNACEAARESYRQAEKVLARKHMAWALKLLGDVSLRGHRPTEALSEYKRSLRILKRHPCPLIESKVLAAAASAAHELGKPDMAAEWSNRCAEIARALSDSWSSGQSPAAK